MKTDLTSLKSDLKKEFKRLTEVGDLGKLKSELNRLANEIRNFDLTAAIPVAQRTRLEKRYRQLKKRMFELQKQVDQTFAKVTALIRRSGSAKKATSRKAVRKSKSKLGVKSAVKPVSKNTKATPKSTTRKKAVRIK